LGYELFWVHWWSSGLLCLWILQPIFQKYIKSFCFWCFCFFFFSLFKGRNAGYTIFPKTLLMWTLNNNQSRIVFFFFFFEKCSCCWGVVTAHWWLVAVQNHGEKEEHRTETEVFQTEWWSIVIFFLLSIMKKMFELKMFYVRNDTNMKWVVSRRLYESSLLNHARPGIKIDESMKNKTVAWYASDSHRLVKKIDNSWSHSWWTSPPVSVLTILMINQKKKRSYQCHTEE
jgi:hypothetical protein